MTGQEFIDLADPQEKMRRLNPHSRIGFMFPGFALGALVAVAAWVASDFEVNQKQKAMMKPRNRQPRQLLQAGLLKQTLET